jgi:hydrogenase expression/formation protein HypE
MAKLSSNDLQKMLNCIKKDSRVIIPPRVGYDSGVHIFDGKYMVVATDPCTGVPDEWFGYLLINYAASDVALSGAKPEFCTINLLGPKTTKAETFQEVMRQTCRAADDLNIAIVRGHTGKYDSVLDLLGVATIYGAIQLEKLITPANAKPGDLIFCTKPLGLETIINFSVTHRQVAQKIFGAQQQDALSKQVRMQSCVGEAQALAKTNSVYAMHDATEGGFVACLNELAEASDTGFVVEWEKIPITKEALLIKEHFGLNDVQVLSMSSTGTIIGAVNPEAEEEIQMVLRSNGLLGSYIGSFTENKQRVLIKKGQKEPFPQISNDPYDLILSGS